MTDGKSNNSLDTLLAQWRDGDNAAGEQVLSLAYSELRQLAAVHFRHENPGHTLQPTALFHDVFLKLANGRPVPWQSRTHFFAVFSRNVRQILVDHARRNKALKRQDAQLAFVSAGTRAPQYESLLTVDGILTELEELDSRAARVVELKVFGGLNENEIAEAMEISLSTVKRDWNFARAWLLKQLKSQG